MIGIEHWVIESAIALLGLWAVWKSLPRDPNIPWSHFQANIIHALMGNSLPEPVFPRPFTLLEWTDIRSDSPQLQVYLQKRLTDWIVVGTDPLVGKWCGYLSTKTLCVDWSNTAEVLSQLEETLKDRSQRFVFLSSGEDSGLLLQFLHANPPVRDFTGAVLLIEPHLDEEWMLEHFNNKQMDVEANVSVPYFVCQSEGQSFQFVPPADESGWKAIEMIQCDSMVHQWFQEQNTMWVQVMAMLMVKRKESV